MADKSNIEADRSARILKTSEAFFYHAHKHSLSFQEVVCCLAATYATVIDQVPDEKRKELEKWFRENTDPERPRIVTPDRN